MVGRRVSPVLRKLRYYIIVPAFAFILGVGLVRIVGWDSEGVIIGAAVSTALTVFSRALDRLL
jgi:predicted Kef-type K+ transport protein